VSEDTKQLVATSGPQKL